MDISVVCPFYNEEGIIQKAVHNMLKQLSSLNGEWELILVDDGSTDGSAEIVQNIAKVNPELRSLGYPINRGRGHALRTGITAARGDIVVTTEIDLSWGENIVIDLVAAMQRWPDADIVVASPNLPGGGYRNVPLKRVWLSRLGNRVIRTAMSNTVTMNTGMTRAYRRDLIQALPLYENGKEFHLEVILKAKTLGYRIREIPAVLEWKEYKHCGKKVRRKSSSNVNRLILSHTLFSIIANPVRYVWAISMLSVVLGISFSVASLILLYLKMVAAYSALMGASLIILGILLFVLGVVLQQGKMIQRELWLLQKHQINLHNPNETLHSDKASAVHTRTPSIDLHLSADLQESNPSSHLVENEALVKDRSTKSI
jgi:glycosyltransferase involved in cell wall biosynthesis